MHGNEHVLDDEHASTRSQRERQSAPQPRTDDGATQLGMSLGAGAGATRAALLEG
jgi:hypothetical protein